MGSCLSSPAQGGDADGEKPPQPADELEARSAATQATSMKVEAGSTAAVSDLASSASGGASSEPRAAAGGSAAVYVAPGASSGGGAAAPEPNPADKLGRRSVGEIQGAAGDAGGRSPPPLLSRMSLTGLTRASPNGGGVGDYLRRHSSEGIRKQLDNVKRANQALAVKAHGKDDSGDHAVASIDPSVYY